MNMKNRLYVERIDKIYFDAQIEREHNSSVVREALNKRHSKDPYSESLYEMLYSKYKLTRSQPQNIQQHYPGIVKL